MDIKKLVLIFIKPVLTLLLGILLACLPTETLTEVIFIILGIALFLLTIEPFIQSAKELKYKTPVAYEHFFSNLVILVLSVLMIFFYEVIELSLGFILIGIAILNMVINKTTFVEGLKNECIKIGLGIILIIFGFSGVLNVLLTIIGWILIAISILFIVLEIIAITKGGLTNDD